MEHGQKSFCRPAGERLLFATCQFAGNTHWNIEIQQANAIGKKMLTDSSLAPASIYFKFYLHQALVKAGLGNDYLNWLDLWRENIKMGMTTWAEISDINNARSDCHAWGASPNIEFFRTVLGIDSDAPGFAKVKIEPKLGD